MKTLRFILFSFITLTIISNAQTVITPGEVSGTWALGGSPYEIQGEITIPDGLTLTIEPGVLVEFQGHYKLNVQGRLLAVGTETDTIAFTINDTTGFHNPSIPDGGWHGIRFDTTSVVNDSSKITYCKLQYGKAIGSWPDYSGGAIFVGGFDKLLISNCLITNNFAAEGGGGIALIYSSSQIMENTISNNSASWGGGIICFLDTSLVIMNNTISNNSASWGGGIVCDHTSLVIITDNIITENDAHEAAGIRLEDCSSITITDNVITSNVAIDDDGGGLYIRDCFDITIEGDTISNNTAEEGGGIWLNDSEATISNNTINDNIAETDGGGIFCRNNCNLILDNVRVSHNTAADDGGGLLSYYSNLQIDNCNFTGNTALGNYGGALDYWNFGDPSNAGVIYQVVITNSHFSNNSAPDLIGGVGIAHSDTDSSFINVIIDSCKFIDNSSDHYTGLHISGKRSEFTVTNCVFSGNTAVQYTAGASFHSESSGMVSNCLFNSNTAATGGGNWNSGGAGAWAWANVDFINCTFADNSAAYGGGLGVGRGSVVTTTNCIFWGNSTDQIALITYDNEGGTLTVNYCDVQGGKDSVNIIDTLSTLNWDEGNIDADPFFVNPLVSDFHLQDTSPCVQTAIDTIEIAGVMCVCPPYDIEGYPRPYPEDTMPDMGAYEYQFLVGVGENETIHPTEYALYQNYPNPFNPTTTIKYQIPELSFVTIKLFDLLGSEIATLANEEKPIGSYEVVFDATNLPSGVYFYRLQAGSFVETKKMVLMK
jgi:parallel beta-helix repeat protein